MSLLRSPGIATSYQETNLSSEPHEARCRGVSRLSSLALKAALTTKGERKGLRSKHYSCRLGVQKKLCHSNATSVSAKANAHRR